MKWLHFDGIVLPEGRLQALVEQAPDAR